MDTIEVIMLRGKKGSGKDFVAKHLVKKHGYKRIAFADPMKEIIADTFNINENLINIMKNSDQSIDVPVQNEHVYITMREILQRFGTEAMKKQFGNGVWVVLAYNKICELRQQGKNKFVISDFRFKIEYELMLQKLTLGFLRNKVDLKTVEIESEKTKNQKDSHSSETELDDFNFDITLQNDGKTNKILNLIDEYLKNKI